jgi:hypothetical protein
MGFLVTGLAITAYLMWRLGVPWPNALATSLVLVVVMYQIFSIYLRVPLPRGVVGW